MKPGRALRGMNRLVPTRPRLRLPPRLARDQYLWYTATLAPIALLTALADGKFDDAWAVVAMAPVFVGAQALLGLVPSARRPLTDLGWSFLRLLVAFGFVDASMATSPPSAVALWWNATPQSEAIRQRLAETCASTGVRTSKA